MPHPNHGCILVDPAGRRIAEAFQYAQVAYTAIQCGSLHEAAGTAACDCHGAAFLERLVSCK